MTVNNIYIYVYLCKSAVKEQEWTNIEISQTLMARKYWYRVKYNGEEVRSKKKLWLSSTLTCMNTESVSQLFLIGGEHGEQDASRIFRGNQLLILAAKK